MCLLCPYVRHCILVFPDRLVYLDSRHGIPGEKVTLVSPVYAVDEPITESCLKFYIYMSATDVYNMGTLMVYQAWGNFRKPLWRLNGYEDEGWKIVQLIIPITSKTYHKGITF